MENTRRSGAETRRTESSRPVQGQFSFAPATQTTVVTTTTTTTTTFPPFAMKAPRHLQDRDPEHYPLASTPTPRALKRLKLDIGDQVAFFEEAEDTDDRVAEYECGQAGSQDNKRVIRSEVVKDVLTSQDASLAAFDDMPQEFGDAHVAENLRNRSATPISMSDAAELSSFHRRNSRPRLTPRSARQRQPRRSDRRTVSVLDSETDPSEDERPTSSNTPLDLGITHMPEQGESCAAVNTESTVSTASSFTPPTADLAATRSHRSDAARSNGLNVDTSPTQDQSLPSPSLSPITSNAALQRPRPLSRAIHHILGSSSESLQLSNPTPIGPDSSAPKEPQQSKSPPAEEELQNNITPNTNVPDLPKILNSFDEMPDELKTYMMYQFLRRCSKSTIRFVADAIDPAMRCDYVGRLPAELSLHILGYLDAQSMCRAAQVSRKWRQIVDSHEQAWRSLINTDGFKLTDQEVLKACHEGWGWQIKPHGSGRRSQLRNASASVTHAQGPISGEDSAEDFEPAAAEASSKKKRKNLAKPRSSKKPKQLVKRTTAGGRPPPLAKTKGPSAYVDFAKNLCPAPTEGLESLGNLHLFKSIYQRHHVMRSNWMNPQAQPLHLAFRAHNRHVVTCLQFDDHKILTGSDDAHIDIYDTKSGAALRRLSGHEGGVWALEYYGDLLVSGSTDRSVRVWDMRNGRMLHAFQGHTSTVRCLQILLPSKIGEYSDGTPILMPKQPLIITGSRDSTCRVWRLPKLDDRSVVQNGPPVNDNDNPFFLRTLMGHNHSVRAIAAYGDTLVSGSYDTFVRVWKISTGECMHRLIGHTSKVYSVVLDYSRRRCISGSMDNMVKVWNIENGTCLFNLDGHTSLVGLLDLRDDYLVSAAADATLRVWNPANGQCQHILTSHENAITCFLHDGQKIISGSEKVLKMWNTKTGECVKDLLTRLDGVWQIKFDERRCIAAVQRHGETYIEVLDFGLCGEALPAHLRGRRIPLDTTGRIIQDEVEMDGYPEGMMLDGQ